MELDEFTLVVMRGVRDFVQPTFDAQSRRMSAIETALKTIERLEARLADVEKRGLRYLGVYQRAMDYRRGDATTHDGSLWIATDDTRGQPGVDANWQLAVKRGRDGKDVSAQR
jgi:hypothetical protein